MSAMFIVYLLNIRQPLFMVLESTGCISSMQINTALKITLYNEIKVILFVSLLLYLTVINKMANG